jgi:hypothetical protein
MKTSDQPAHPLTRDLTHLNAARAERAEAAETVALAQWNGALERAMKAEADLATAKSILNSETNRAEKAEEDCRFIILDFINAKEVAERYRLLTLRQDAELAAERARLDSGTILLTVAGERVWHCGVDLRAAIDAGMREGAK